MFKDLRKKPNPWFNAALLAANILFVLLVCRMYLFPRYSVDSFSYVFNQQGYAIGNMHDFRVIQGLIQHATGLLGGNIISDQLYSTALLILAIGCSSFLLTKRFMQFMPAQDALTVLFVNACILIAFVNVYFVEWFHFVEAAMTMAVCVLATSCAVLCFTGGRKWYHWVLALLFLMIADHAYQVYFELFIIFGVGVTLLQENFVFSGKLVKRTLLLVLVAFISASSTIIVNKLAFGGNEAGSDYRAIALDASLILEKLRWLISCQKGLLEETMGFLPKGTLIVPLVAYVLALGAGLMRTRRVRWPMAVYLLVVLLGCYAAVYAPHLVMPVHGLTARTLFAVFSFIGMLGILAFASVSKRVVKLALLACAGGLLLLNAYRIPQFGKDQIVTNALDRQMAISVAQAVQDYQEDTGEQINKIAIVQDGWCSPKYEGVGGGAFHESYMRVFTTGYQGVVAMNYYAGTHLEYTQMDDTVYETYFAGKDWDHFVPREQLVFIGDTLYMAVY